MLPISCIVTHSINKAVQNGKTVSPRYKKILPALIPVGTIIDYIITVALLVSSLTVGLPLMVSVILSSAGIAYGLMTITWSILKNPTFRYFNFQKRLS